MNNFTINAMSDEALKRLLTSSNEYLRWKAEHVLKQRKCAVEEVGKRKDLPKLKP